MNINIILGGSLGVVERVGRTMQQAGVAITVTSVTDFIAFGIGATTQLPALRSFCMYAAIGILTIFFFQVTNLLQEPRFCQMYHRPYTTDLLSLLVKV